MKNKYNSPSLSREKTRDIFFFGAFVLIMLFQLHNLSAFYQKEFVIRYVFKYLSFLLATISFLFSFKSLMGKEIMAVVFLIFLSVIIGLCNGEWYTVVVSMLLVCSSKGIYYRRILNCFLFVSGCFCFCMVVGNLLGFIPDMSYDIGDNRMTITETILERKSFGYLYPTDFSNHLFFIVLCYWVLRNGSFKFIEYMLCLVFAIIIILYTDTKAAAICFVLLIIISSLINKRKMKKFFSILPYTIPFFCILSLFTTIYYDEANINWLILDLFFSGRLHYQQNAFYDAGVTLFGQQYEMYSMMNNGANAIYNYVDSSYIQILIFNGCIYFLFFLIANYVICKKAKRYGLDYLNIAIMIAGLNGLFGQWFWQIYYCPFMMLLYADFSKYKHNSAIVAMHKL